MNVTKMKWYASCILFFLFAQVMFTPVMATGTITGPEVQQQRVVKGTVKDTTGEPLFGVNIVVKGTTNGAITDFDGNFSIEIAGEGTLVASYIGFKPQEIQVRGGEFLNITLQDDAEALEEVVVVGYGVQRKSDVTGALASVKGEELSKLSISRADQALQGQLAGVMVQNSIAAPGQDLKIVIRGGNSLSGDNNPLIVIDGVLGGDLTLVDPNDIVSIEVLKDASSTSIYGSRGANGVIMVTTKRGSASRATVSYSGYITVSNVEKKLDLLNGKDTWDVIQATMDDPTYALTMPGWFDPNNLYNTDWQDEIFRTAPVTGHSLSISGGSESTRYSIAGNYMNQQGVIKNTGATRAGIRVNLEQDLAKNFKVGVLLNASRFTSSNTSINQGNGSDGGGITFAALAMGPLVPVYDEEGNLSGPLRSGAQLNNPVALLNDKVVDNSRNYFQGTAFAEWEVIKGLRLRTSWSYTNSNRKQKKFVSGENLLEAKGLGEAYLYDRETANWLGENTITYDKLFNGKHSLNVVGGFTAEATDYFNHESTAKGFDIESLGYWNTELADKNNLTIKTGGDHSAIASFLGRVNYAYMGKYLFSASFRADGASKFAKNNKWAYFPSASVGWRVSEEEFMRDIEWLHNFKLRGSYGVTGSQAISAYQSLSNFSTSTYVLNENSAVALIPGRVPNPDLKWETTRQTNIGLDLSVFAGRLGVVVDYYYKKTVDLLYNKRLPYYTGYTTQVQNIGSIRNKGWELSVNSLNLNGAFKWSTGFNISFNRDKVLDLGEDTFFYTDGSGGALGSDFKESTRIEVGQSMGNFYGYIFDGIFQNQAEADALKSSTSTPGGVKFKDLNNDGEITAQDDRTVIGNANPKFVYGITNDFSYKNFDLSFLLQGTYGNDIMNLMRAYFDEVPSRSGINPGGAMFSRVKDYWRGEGTSNTQQAANQPAGTISSRYVEDGSYMRLKNLTLGYTLPRSVTDKWKIGTMRMYVSGQNLFTITGYSGYDPEVSSHAGSTTQRTANTALGYDMGSYPSARSYTFGLNVTF